MEPIGVLVAAAAVSLAVWVGAVGLTWWSTRPNEVRPGLPTSDLDDEPPAIAGLLTEGFRVTTEAVPATLLDLAAHGVVTIERIPGARDQVRVDGRARDGLRPYERQILDHVRSVAVDGIVPAEALTTGPRDAARGWWGRFRRAVIADAHERGLAAPRFPWAVVAPLWVGLVVVGLIFFASVRFDLENAEGWSSVLFFAIVAAGASLVALTGSSLQRDTPAGLAAAARWLAVRAHLAQNEVLRGVPPSAVAVYGRHLAYAAAMDLAPAAASALPLGAEDDHVAWSSEGGRWRRVRVRYPRFRPAWGMHPGLAAVLAAVWTAPSLFLLLSLEPGGTVGIVIRVVLLAAAAAALAVVAAAMADLSARRTVDGTVLRLRSRHAGKASPWRRREKRRYYVALDDGTSATVAAWSVSPVLYGRLAQRFRARATVSPRLRFVEDIELL